MTGNTVFDSTDIRPSLAQARALQRAAKDVTTALRRRAQKANCAQWHQTPVVRTPRTAASIFLPKLRPAEKQQRAATA